MKIVTVRRIAQIFFFSLFTWFCIVSTVGEKFWQIRAWPINFFLELDPLVAIGTILTTHTLYWTLTGAIITVLLTILFGRFFCGWVCPFGSIHHFFGFLSKKNKTTAQKVKLNKYRKAQNIKYFILIAFLVIAAFPSLQSSLQIGLLDPITLVTRSFNLVIVPIVNRFTGFISVPNRFYEGAWLVFGVFFAAVLLNFVIPRFYCRFICPLGALFGVIDRFAIWRIGKTQKECIDCKLCEQDCDGACEPSGNMRISECILCFNCFHKCQDDLIKYQTQPSLAGEITSPDVSRRGFLLSLVGGLTGIWATRLGNKLGSNWYNKTIRPPGALEEEEFLKRCIKCGQCMRVCPTNVIQPAGIQGGLENLWTPVLNNRIGSSGCQLNCVACGQVCPTSAIRPIKLSEKLGTAEFKDAGPIKIGTAFFDRNRCLPWAMNKPCIVCQENCPVSPKAIYTEEYFSTIRDGIVTVKEASESAIETVENDFSPGQLASGDFYFSFKGKKLAKIVSNTENIIEFAPELKKMVMPSKGDKIGIQVRLQKPFVDIEKCIGCGVCEHECPVSGKKAIRVSAEGETRSAKNQLLLKR